MTFVKPEMTDLQREMHLPENLDLGPQHSGNELRSDIFIDYRRTTHILHKPYKLIVEHLTDLEGITPKKEIKFTINGQRSGLKYSELSFELPAIKCKDTYTAMWRLDNLITRCNLYLDDIKLQSFDTITIEMYLNSMISEAFKKQIKTNAGYDYNIKTPVQVIEKDKISLQLPWLYNFDHYFPLYKCGKLNKLIHEVIYTQQISDLMVCYNSLGEKVSFGEAISSSPELLTIPVMTAELLLFSDLELDYLNEIEGPARSNTIYYTDFIESLSGSLNSNGFPVYMLGFGSIENIDKKRVFSENIDLVSIKTSPDTDLITDIDFWKTNRVYTIKHLQCVPDIKGLGFWYLGTKFRLGSFNSGLTFTDGALKFIYSEDAVGEPVSEPVCRLFVTKKLKFTSSTVETSVSFEV
jgi:hypothetical protein